MGKHPLRHAAWTAVAVVVLLAAGCGGGSSNSSGSKEQVVHVKVRDFRISAPKRISAGPIGLEVKNKGPIDHELIVARGSQANLPIGPDGINVDEERLEDREIAELEPSDPGTHALRLNLRPGRYVFLCNMSGHFKGGMHTEVLVR